MSDSNRIVPIDEARIASVERRQDRYETITTEALKDILTKISLIADAQADIRDEVHRLGRDIVSTRAAVADVDASAMKRRKARK